jgi:hypothetical protein
VWLLGVPLPALHQPPLQLERHRDLALHRVVHPELEFALLPRALLRAQRLGLVGVLLALLLHLAPGLLAGLGIVDGEYLEVGLVELEHLAHGNPLIEAVPPTCRGVSR